MEKLSMSRQHIAPALSGREIHNLFECLDQDGDGYITLHQIVAAFEAAQNKILPREHDDRWSDFDDSQRAHEAADIRTIILDLMHSHNEVERISQEEFAECVSRWQIPSSEPQGAVDSAYLSRGRRISWKRRARTYLAIHSLNMLFMTFVVAIQVSCGIWQMMRFVEDPLARAALGWGVISAKFTAGALYPTLTLMLLSMSRHLNTFLRRSSVISRIVNYDHSQMFHRLMAVEALVLATVHGVSHLMGDMVWQAEASKEEEVAEFLGPERVPTSYLGELRLRPAITGIAALGIFWLIALLSMPFIRRRCFEVFQLTHLLMFPMIGLLCAHGTLAILQKPMLGYWLALPTLLVIYERLLRLSRGLTPVRAKVRVLDNDVVRLTCMHPRGRNWNFRAGQYVLVQVPNISRFQWHPFTVSSCRGSDLEVHIKSSGDWTRKLRDWSIEGIDICLGIDGPFGAPAQRFYDYDRAIIIGNGIGITPCSAILADMEDKLEAARDPWLDARSQKFVSTTSLRSPSKAYSKLSRRRLRDTGTSFGGFPDPLAPWESTTTLHPMDYELKNRVSCESLYRKPSPSISISPSTVYSSRGSTRTFLCQKTPTKPPAPRHVDFHWTVRDKTNLLWFSDLLNRTLMRAELLSRENLLHINTHSYITAKWNNPVEYVAMHLLDKPRPHLSALTGLRQKSHLGRPDFEEIMERHFEGLLREVAGEVLSVGVEGKRIGVFYCGPPAVGETLAELCRHFTARAKAMRLRIRYELHVEVF